MSHWRSVQGVNRLLDVSARLVIAHRGASVSAPENTLEAFRLAMQLGADALELDVHASADGTPVVFHDAGLHRTTDRTGMVASLSCRDLRSVDAGFRFTQDGGRSFPWRGRGVRIPELSEVLEEFADVPIIVEIKAPAVQEAVARLLRKHDAIERCVVAADSDAAVNHFRGPPYLRGASSRDIARLFLGCAAGLPPRSVNYRLLAVPRRHRGLYVPTPRFVAAAHRLGCPVHVWTVDDPSDAKLLWDVGVSGILTNDPEMMVGVRDER